MSMISEMLSIKKSLGP